VNPNLIPVINVSSEVTKRDGTNDGIWYFGDRIDLKRELIIGFSPTNYHCFIICGDQEFHPRFATNPCKLKDAKKDNIRAALFIRFYDISPDELENFQQFLIAKKGSFTPSCQEGLLQILKKGLGLSIPGIKSKNILPKAFITNIFEKGLVNSENKKLRFDIYSTREKSLQNVFSDISVVETKLTWVFNLSSFIYNHIVKVLLPWKVIR
jgi:hypothetical protein